MEIHDYAPSLQRLMHHVRAWDHASGDPAGGGLSAAARAALLDELGVVAGAPARGAARAPRWEALTDFLRPAGATPDAQRARCEGRMLRGYEQLCERELPLHVSSMLLRQYSTIRRAGVGR